MESYLPLLDEKVGAFDGETYEPERDHGRLTSQLSLVRVILAEHAPLTLSQIQVELAKRGCRASEASISARIRDLRKPRYGAHTILRENIGGGLWTYQMPAGLE